VGADAAGRSAAGPVATADGRAAVIRLGHIDYSNCVPPHARLLWGAGARAVRIVRGTPAELNAALSRGEIDVAPCSSIEFARHADRYRILPGLAIASDGPVGSILLETTVEPAALDGRLVLVPTASATSVVLLRCLLELYWGVRPRLAWFAQETLADPFAAGAAGVLWIGDIALRRSPSRGHIVTDLGAAWTTWTDLPFAFAVWQTTLPEARDADLAGLHAALVGARDDLPASAAALAARVAPDFGLDAGRLAAYWRALRYTLDARVERGLLHFFALAARLGEAPVVTRLVRVALPPR
jgi:chorismate dehydratase